MFSKVLAFGLAALALVHAAPPSQVPMVSCSVNIGTSVGTPKPFNTFGVIEPGIYYIDNVASKTWVRSSYQEGRPVYVSYLWGEPDISLWKVEPVGGSDEYRISTYPGGSSASVSQGGGLKDHIFSGAPDNGPDSFTIVPGDEEGTFIISVPNEDKVWTAKTPTAPRSAVDVERQNGSEAQLWKFRHPAN